MQTDQEKIREAIAKAARHRGFGLDGKCNVDIDDPVFVELRTLASVKDGAVVGVERVVELMQKVKPDAFTDPSDLSDADFARLDAELRGKHSKPQRVRLTVDGVDAARLSREEFDALDRHIRGKGSADERAILATARDRIAAGGVR